MNILKNIIPVKSVAGASGNQHFNNDLNDDEDDGFVLVDDHVPNQASYFQVMVYSKKGSLGKGKEDHVSFVPDHRGVYIIKVKNTNVLGGIGMEFFVNIKIRNKSINFENISSSRETNSSSPKSHHHTDEDDHDFHKVEMTDVKNKDKKELKKQYKQLKASETWEIRMDLSDPYSPFFGLLHKVGKDDIEIQLISGVSIGLRYVYYQVDIFEEFEQMILREDSVAPELGGLGEFKTQFNSVGVYKLFIENISHVSSLATLQGLTGMGSTNYNFDVTVLSGFLNQFKEDISPITYIGTSKNDIFKQLLQYYELYEENQDGNNQQAKQVSLYMSDPFPCYPSIIPMDFVIKVQHHALANRPNNPSPGALKFRILIGYIQKSNWEVAICDHIFNMGEKLTQAMNSKDGDLIQSIVNEIESGIVKIPKRKETWRLENTDEHSHPSEEKQEEEYEATFRVNILKFDSRYLQIAIQEYFENAKAMLEDLHRLEEEFNRALQTRFILSDISLENIKQLKSKSENYCLKSNKLTELIQEAADHISKMDNEYNMKTEVKDKIKYLEENVLSATSSSTSSLTNDLFVRNCSKVDSEQELSRVYQDAVDFRKRARKILENLVESKGDTQLDMKRLDQFITIIRHQRELQTEFSNLISKAKREKNLSEIRSFWDEKGTILTKDSYVKYVECVNYIEEEIRKEKLLRQQEEERKKKELELKRKKMEEEKRRQEEEKRRREEEERKKLEHKILEEQQRKLDELVKKKHEHQQPVVTTSHQQQPLEEEPAPTTSSISVKTSTSSELVVDKGQACHHVNSVSIPSEKDSNSHDLSSPQQVGEQVNAGVKFTAWNKEPIEASSCPSPPTVTNQTSDHHVISVEQKYEPTTSTDIITQDLSDLNETHNDTLMTFNDVTSNPSLVEDKDDDVLSHDELSSSSNSLSSHSQKENTLSASSETPQTKQPKTSSRKKSKSIHKENSPPHPSTTVSIENSGGLIVERKKKSDKKKKPKKKTDLTQTQIIEMFPEVSNGSSSSGSSSDFPKLILPSSQSGIHSDPSSSNVTATTNSSCTAANTIEEEKPGFIKIINYGSQDQTPVTETPTEVVQSLRENVKQLIFLASQKSQSTISTVTGVNDEVFFKFNCTNEHPFDEHMERICVSIENLLIDHRLEKKQFLTNKPYKESPVQILKGLSPQGDAIVKEFNKFIEVSGVKKKLPNDPNKDSNLTHLLIQFCFHKDAMTTLLLQLVHFSTLNYLKKFYDPEKSLLLNTSYRDELGATIELLKQLKLSFKFIEQFNK
nr:unnamed protein product [Naegleria fowleri]